MADRAVAPPHSDGVVVAGACGRPGAMNDQQKKILAGGAFAVVAAAVLYFELSDSSPPAPPAPPVVTTVGTPSGSSSGVSSTPARATGAATKHPAMTAAELDPTLRMGPMLVTESLVYSGTGRNIFSETSVPVALPSPIASARPKPGPIVAPVYIPTGPPPPPPIDLKFFGTATSAAGRRQAFLLRGEDVFMASAGDIVQRRYKVVSIAANSMVVEDLVNSKPPNAAAAGELMEPILGKDQRGRGDQCRRGGGEEGFLLIGALIAIFLVLLVLSVAAPRMARELRREREVEAVHRGNQYVRAVQLYYAKFKRYPGNMEQLEKSNNIRFLRQKYVDPMTGKADWRLIHVGEQKTTLKGFFGQPLAGIAMTGVGGSSIPGATNAIGSPAGSGGSQAGSSLGTGLGSGAGSSPAGGLGSTSTFGSTGGTGSTASSGGTVDSSSGAGSGGISSQSATSFNGGGAPIIGFGSSATGDSIVVLNEQTTYPTWEFIYDPRIEQLKSKSNLLGGGMPSTGATGLTPSGFSSPASTGTQSPAGTTTPSSTPSSPTVP